MTTLIRISRINAPSGQHFNFGSGATNSVTEQPGTEILLAPDTGTLFVSKGAEIYVVPTTAVQQCRVADVDALRDWINARAAKPKSGKAAA